jgi:hypothetical protein
LLGLRHGRRRTGPAIGRKRQVPEVFFLRGLDAGHLLTRRGVPELQPLPLGLPGPGLADQQRTVRGKGLRNCHRGILLGHRGHGLPFGRCHVEPLEAAHSAPLLVIDGPYQRLAVGGVDHGPAEVIRQRTGMPAPRVPQAHGRLRHPLRFTRQQLNGDERRAVRGEPQRLDAAGRCVLERAAQLAGAEVPLPHLAVKLPAHQALAVPLDLPGHAPALGHRVDRLPIGRNEGMIDPAPVRAAGFNPGKRLARCHVPHDHNAARVVGGDDPFALR